MATKRFSMNTDPHVLHVGDDLTLEFEPEAGTEFLDAYGELLDLQKSSDLTTADGVKAVTAASRELLAKKALPSSAAKLRDPETFIPLRHLSGMVEWLTQTYTGSGEGAPAGARPTARR